MDIDSKGTSFLAVNDSGVLQVFQGSAAVTGGEYSSVGGQLVHGRGTTFASQTPSWIEDLILSPSAQTAGVTEKPIGRVDIKNIMLFLTVFLRESDPIKEDRSIARWFSSKSQINGPDRC